MRLIHIVKHTDVSRHAMNRMYEHLTRHARCGIMGYWGDDSLATTDQEIEMSKSTKSAAAAAPAEATGTRIRPNWDSLTKVQAASGKRSFDNADALATALRGKTLNEAYALCVKALKAEGEPTTVKALKSRYEHLNPGHQRMCIGNKVRAAMKRSADGVVRTS